MTGFLDRGRMVHRQGPPSERLQYSCKCHMKDRSLLPALRAIEGQGSPKTLMLGYPVALEEVRN